MASKHDDSRHGKPEITPEQGIKLLGRQISEGRKLLAKRSLHRDAKAKWDLLTRNYLEKAFGKGSPNVGSITSVGVWDAPRNGSEESAENHRVQTLKTKIARLQGLVELLRTEKELGDSGRIKLPGTQNGHRIFLVHGHDKAALHEVARFLKQLEQEVIILREQPNQGRTIIEKFEDYADVGFAVVLLTADDRGGRATDSDDAQKFRARQNVIFELGYFVGRLSRNRVCALYRVGVEIPSDYSGVIYEQLDEKGAWRLALARELRAAGLPVDMNNAL